MQNTEKLLNDRLLTEYIFDLLWNKDQLTLSADKIDDVAGLYGYCLFVDKDEFEGYDCTIFDENGEPFMHIDKDLVDGYSCDDFLFSPMLYRHLDEMLTTLNESELLVLLN